MVPISTDLWENGEYYISSLGNRGARGYAIAIRNLGHMLHNLRAGKYVEALERLEGESFTHIPDPRLLIEEARRLGKEAATLPLQLSLYAARQMILQMERTQVELLNLAFEKFQESDPTTDDWELLKKFLLEIHSKGG